MATLLARETQMLLSQAIEDGLVSRKSLKQIKEIIQNDINTEIDYVNTGNSNGVLEISLVKEIKEK